MLGIEAGATENVHNLVKGRQHDGILVEQADTFVVYVFFGVDVDLIAHGLKPID